MMMLLLLLLPRSEPACSRQQQIPSEPAGGTRHGKTYDGLPRGIVTKLPVGWLQLGWVRQTGFWAAPHTQSSSCVLQCVLFTLRPAQQAGSSPTTTTTASYCYHY